MATPIEVGLGTAFPWVLCPLSKYGSATRGSPSLPFLVDIIHSSAGRGKREGIRLYEANLGERRLTGSSPSADRPCFYFWATSVVSSALVTTRRSTQNSSLTYEVFAATPLSSVATHPVLKFYSLRNPDTDCHYSYFCSRKEMQTTSIYSQVAVFSPQLRKCRAVPTTHSDTTRQQYTSCAVDHSSSCNQGPCSFSLLTIS